MSDKTVKLGLDATGVSAGARAAASAVKDAAARVASDVAASASKIKADMKGSGEAVKALAGALGGVSFSKIIDGGHGLAKLAPRAQLAVDAIHGVARAALSAGEALGKMVLAGAALGITQTDLRNETEGAWSRVLHSQKAAHALYEKVNDAAMASGQTQAGAIKHAMDLLRGGFKYSQITPLVKLFGDIEKFKGPGGSEALVGLLTKVQNLDKFDSKGLKVLAKEGINARSVIDEIAKTSGKTSQQVWDMLNGGGKGGGKGKKGGLAKESIDAATAIKAIQNVIRNRIGGVAGADSIGDIWNAAKIGFARMFDSIDFSPVKRVMGRVLKMLMGPEGAMLKKSISSLFGAMAEGLEALLKIDPKTGKSGIQGIAEGITAVAASIRSSKKDLSEFGSTISSVASKAKQIWEVASALSGMAGAWVKFMTGRPGEAGKDWFGGLMELLGATGALGKGAGGLDTGAIGTGMVTGIVEGITGGAAGIVNALTAACEAAISSAKGVLGIASPSKVFAGIGRQLPAGLGVGIAANAGVAAGAARDLGAKTAGAGGGGIGAAGGGGGGGSGARNLTVNYSGGPAVNVPPGASPADTAAHTQAANTGALAAFGDHVGDLWSRLSEA